MNWIGWSLFSALFAGATAILAKIGVEGVNSHVATAVRTGVVFVFAWSIVLGTGAGGGVCSLSRRTWTFLALSGIATGLSWLCYFRALQLGPATSAFRANESRRVFSVRPGIAWRLPNAKWFHPDGKWIVGIGTRVEFGPGGTATALNVKFRGEFDFRGWWNRLRE